MRRSPAFSSSIMIALLHASLAFAQQGPVPFEEAEQLRDALLDLDQLRAIDLSGARDGLEGVRWATLTADMGVHQEVDPRIFSGNLLERYPELEALNTLRDALASAQVRRCSDAVRALRQARSASMDSPSLIGTVEASREYDRACLDAVPVASDLKAAGFDSTVGVLLDGSGQPFCGAVRIKRGRLLTARHCFFKKETGARTRFFDAVSFSAFGGIHPALPLRADQPEADDPLLFAGDPIPHERDHIVLSLAADPLREPRVRFRAPISFEPIVLAGFYSGRDGTRRPAPENEHPWRTGARWVGRPTCLVQTVGPEGCVYHTCQSEQGFSGSPLVSRTTEEGELVIVGVHVAPAAHPGTCSQATVPGVGNIAAALPPNLFTTEETQ